MSTVQQASMGATCLAVAIASLAVGYMFGAGSTLGISRGHDDDSEHEKREAKNANDDDDDESSADEDEDLSKVKAAGDEPCKLVLVVRSDLQMTKGKIAAQCGHATLACYESLVKSNPELIRHWKRTGQAKIAVKCDSEEELLILQATAKSLGICARSIQDAGRTQVAAGSTTVLGIGPAPVSVINQVTSQLKLL